MVPIAYGPKEKFMVRLREDPEFGKQVAITLPRIGFEITSITYDAPRKKSSTFKKVMINNNDTDNVKTTFTPVPYNITISLAIMARNADDAAQILEQILPYFRPEFTTSVRLVPEMDIVVDTPVVLQSVSMEDSYEGDFETRRALIYTLDFIIKAYMFGPVHNSGLIKRAITYIHDGRNITDPLIEKITVTPSQYANGAPLYSPSANAALSISINSINANSDYGFTTDIEIDPRVLETSNE